MFPGVTVRLKEGAHIGHGAIVHGATIGRNCLIGMNSVIMDGVEIGEECIIGALSFIKAGEKIPMRSLVAGSPAKILKEVSDEMLRWKMEGTAIYQALPGDMKAYWKLAEEPGNLQKPPAEERSYRPWKETRRYNEYGSDERESKVAEPTFNYGFGKRKFTIEDYLETETGSVQKHEYYNGEIFLMSGTRLDHNVITANLMGLLCPKLKNSPCQVFGSDLRVYVEANGLFTYPDLSIVCGEPVTRENDEFNLMNPSGIIEVSSPSTKEYDRGDKFKLYQELSTLREYVLIDSKSVLVEQFVKNANGEWILQRYNEPEEFLQIETVGISLSLKEIYDRTQFPKLTH
jgi:Uma2 family endonuclease